jgi:hypothetical protein
MHVLIFNVIQPARGSDKHITYRRDTEQPLHPLSRERGGHLPGSTPNRVTVTPPTSWARLDRVPPLPYPLRHLHLARVTEPRVRPRPAGRFSACRAVRRIEVLDVRRARCPSRPTITSQSRPPDRLAGTDRCGRQPSMQHESWTLDLLVPCKAVFPPCPFGSRYLTASPAAIVRGVRIVFPPSGGAG